MPRSHRGRRTLAWLVHLYTASGALAALFGTMAVFDGRVRASFLWMIAATIVDSTDGLFARRAQVKAVLPGFDGGRLDDIVDYLTFVFLPVLLLYHTGQLPDGWDWAVASVVLISSAYGFGFTDAKTDDAFFTGFPSYWNIVALYLYVSGLSPLANGAILLALSGLVFVRIGYVYPSRTPALRSLTIGLGMVWGLLIIAIVLALPATHPALIIVSLFYPIYYTALSLVLHFKRAWR